MLYAPLRFARQNSSPRSYVATLAFLVSAILLFPLLASAQEASLLSEEESRQVQLAERFLTVLQKNPRRGTALDRIYGHHVEFGTLDSFIEKLRQGTVDAPEDGTHWMLLGLFEWQRGNDAEAIEAFTKAESLRPSDALAPFYASQSMLRIAETDQAIAALERAIAAKPDRTDLMEIFQQLGRALQRAQRTNEALAVWKRFENEFPDDPRVLELIAITLADENAIVPALQRYEKLATLARDDYKKTTYRIAVAELKIKNKEQGAGIAEFEGILADLNPESWVHRDVRRKIEQIFLRAGDQDGLVGYYERWLEKNPEDVEHHQNYSQMPKFSKQRGLTPLIGL